MTSYNDFEDIVRQEIIGFLRLIEPEILEVSDNEPTTIVGVKQQSNPDPFSSYLHARIQQRALEDPGYNNLADTYFQQLDPSNGLPPEEFIRDRHVFVVERDYVATRYNLLHKINAFGPRSLSYVIVKPPRLIPVQITTPQSDSV